MMEDPPHVPAAMLRPAAVAMLRPLIDTIRHMRSVRLDVSCDPAAVTGQLAVVFLMESGLAEIRGMHRLALNVWVAAEAQLGALVVLAQLRSLDLTLGKQEQESELSVLTRLTRLSYLSLRITPGVWNEIQGRTGRVSAGAALRLAMSFAAGQVCVEAGGRAGGWVDGWAGGRRRARVWGFSTAWPAAGSQWLLQWSMAGPAVRRVHCQCATPEPVCGLDTPVRHALSPTKPHRHALFAASCRRCCWLRTCTARSARMRLSAWSRAWR